MRFYNVPARRVNSAYFFFIFSLTQVKAVDNDLSANFGNDSLRYFTFHSACLSTYLCLATCLYLCLYVHLSASLLARLLVCLSCYLFYCLCFYQSVWCLSIHMSACLSVVSLSICLPVCLLSLYPYVCLSICLPICLLSVCLSACCLSVCLSVCCLSAYQSAYQLVLSALKFLRMLVCLLISFSFKGTSFIHRLSFRCWSTRWLEKLPWTRANSPPSSTTKRRNNTKSS